MVLELFSRPVLRGGVICKVLFWLYPSVIHLFWIERWRPGPIHREARDILAKETGWMTIRETNDVYVGWITRTDGTVLPAPLPLPRIGSHGCRWVEAQKCPSVQNKYPYFYSIEGRKRMSFILSSL
uniref:Uncharacterized protein n=1 Tax=Picea glauca TaxID=3330 RepID=A0A101LUQ1_PICGL|nr:hypothetical protein ABT39_MTgene2541 [Picea glauca]